jgi:hypothetical protein
VVYLALAIALGFGLYRLLSDHSFEVAHVEVRGVRYLAATQVVNATELVGTSIFRVSSSRAREKIMAMGVPEDVTVQAQLPNTVVISVNERPASYLWKSGTSTYAVSADGTVLGLAATDHPSVLLVDDDVRTIEIGKAVDIRALREADYVLRTMPIVAGFTPQSVNYSAALGIAVVSPDGFNIVIGDDQDLAVKLQEAGPALFAARQAHPSPTTIDLRFAGHPFYR